MTIVRTAKDQRVRQALLVAGFLLIAANLRGALVSVGPVLEMIRRDVGLTAGAAGFIGTLPLLTFAAVSPQVPRLARRFGIDRLLWVAMATLAAGIVLRSLPVAGLLWAGTVLLGASIAVGNVLLPSMIKRDFPERIGAVTGVYTAVIGVVASVAAGVTVPLAGVLPGGWRTSLGCWAGLALVAFAAWAPQARRPTGDAGPDAAKPRAPWRSPLAWEVSAYMALSACGYYTMLAWFPSMVTSTGASEDYAGWMLFVYQAGNVVMSVVIPFVLPRLRDQRPVAVAGSTFALAGYLGMLFAPGVPFPWALITGIGAGTLFFLALAFFSLRAADTRSSASLSGMGQSIGYLVGALGPVAIGALHDAVGGWRAPLAVLAGIAAVHTVVGLRAGRNAHVTV